MAGAGQNADDKNFLRWALSVIMDLLFPGKKPKDIIEEGKDDNIDPGKKKKDDNVKVRQKETETKQLSKHNFCIDV